MPHRCPRGRSATWATASRTSSCGSPRGSSWTMRCSTASWWARPRWRADQVPAGVLDAVMTDDPNGRVACETLVNTGLVVVSGEISTETYVDIPKIARETVRRIGYTDAAFGFDCGTCAVITAIDEQSPDIAQGVNQAYEARHDPADDDQMDVAGAGDQGVMFGYATREADQVMPMPSPLAPQLAH